MYSEGVSTVRARFFQHFPSPMANFLFYAQRIYSIPETLKSQKLIAIAQNYYSYFTFFRAIRISKHILQLKKKSVQMNFSMSSELHIDAKKLFKITELV